LPQVILGNIEPTALEPKVSTSPTALNCLPGRP
jgi:hypothetical protein